MEQRRKKRNGKAKPKRKMRQGWQGLRHDPHVRSMEGLPKPRFKMVGSTATMPMFKFPKSTEFWGQSVVNGNAFKTKNGISAASSIIGAAGAYGIGCAFSIGDIPDAASLGSTFDQFLLYRVMVRIKAKNVGTANVSPELYVVHDADNAAAMGTLAAAQAYQNCQVLRGGSANSPQFFDSLVIDIPTTFMVPALAGDIAMPATWLDVAVATTEHYGFRAWYETTSVNDPNWVVDSMYYYGFRNTQ